MDIFRSVLTRHAILRCTAVGHHTQAVCPDYLGCELAAPVLPCEEVNAQKQDTDSAITAPQMCFLSTRVSGDNSNNRSIINGDPSFHSLSSFRIGVGGPINRARYRRLSCARPGLQRQWPQGGCVRLFRSNHPAVVSSCVHGSQARSVASSNGGGSMSLVVNKEAEGVASRHPQHASLLEQMLERSANDPVPQWAVHMPARRLLSAAETLSDTAADICGDDGDSDYVPLLLRSKSSSSTTSNAAALQPPQSSILLSQSSAMGEVQEPSNAFGSAHTEGSDLLGFDGDSNSISAETEVPNDNDNDNSGSSGTPQSRHTKRLILDPLQWLSQDCDAPLMDPELLSGSVAPGAWALEFPSSTDWVDGAGPSEVDAAQDDVDECRAMHEDESGVRLSCDTEPVKTEHQAVAATVKEAVEKDTETTTATLPVSSHEAEEEVSSSQRTTTSLTVPLHNAESERLVYNVFNRRVCKQGSLSIRALELLGIGVDNDTRQLALVDKEALGRISQALRRGSLSWPRAWSRGALYQRIEKILCDERIADPAAKISELLQEQYERVRGRRSVGLVTATADQTDDAVSSALAAEEDKLLSLSELNEEQQRVVQFVLQGYHTYIGGGAGTGKSVLLRTLKQQLIREGLSVAVTGTTGVSSSHIGGCTLHHCFGINIHGEFTRKKELSAYDVLIIDEVSMLPRDLFESLERHMRKHNGVDLPFGGVQVIVCGDFLQLGAISAEPIINSPVFRKNFAMLKLTCIVRQSSDPVFAAQLQQLRRGVTPPSLTETINFLPSAKEVARLKDRQREALAELGLPAGGEPPSILDGDGASITAESDAHSTYVEGAVNLLPTNKEVYETNERELQKLNGEPTVFHPQQLAPSLTGKWSPTYILRLVDSAKLQMGKLVRELELFLAEFFETTEHGQAWVLQSVGQQQIVLYPLFVDAFVLRVRLPPDMSDLDVKRFLHHMDGLCKLLEANTYGVILREIMDSPDGLHTEHDEHLLEVIAENSPITRPLTLKLGARVMLRANLAPGLVNGSLGTVVGFRRLALEEIPKYLISNPQREDAVQTYADFLCYEYGFETAVVPEVDFGGGRIEVIPPQTYYLGGLSNTHYYSIGVTALPLTLAYAFTVHKVQGLTLVGRVHLELSRMWPCEHLLYVAMSRVRNPEQLSVSSFSAALVKTAADCLVFDDSVPPVDNVKVLPAFIPATWRRAPQRRKRVLRRKAMDVLRHKKLKEQRKSAAARRQRLDSEIASLQQQLLSGE